MGESNTSVSVVQYVKGKLKVLAHGYDADLGGRDFDNVLVEHFIKEFKDKYKIDVNTNARALVRLQVACEKMKKVLNTVAEAHLNIECFMNDIDVKGYLKKSQYDEMCEPLLKRLEEVIKNTLNASGVSLAQLTAAETIGGGSRLSTVLNKLQQIVGSQILSQTLNREEAIARACAIQVNKKKKPNNTNKTTTAN